MPNVFVQVLEVLTEVNEGDDLPPRQAFIAAFSQVMLASDEEIALLASKTQTPA